MKILVKTGNMEKAEWLRYRKQGIGGSDAGAVCGLNPYVSPMQVYSDKISTEIEEYDNEAMRIGRDLEDYVAQRFMEATGFKVRRANVMYYHEQYPFMLADVDRLIVGEKAGLECKTVNFFAADQWEGDKIPPHYLIQCYHYMAVTGLRTWYIAALILGKKFLYRKIEWDDEVIRSLIEIETDFWLDHVQKRIAPVPDGSDAANEWLSEHFPRATEGKIMPLQGFNKRLKRRMEVAELIKKLEKEKAQIEQEVKQYLGEAEIAENEFYKVSWKNVESDHLDTNRLKEEKPEVYQAYLTTSQYRRLNIKAA